jgi:hypothetical protein
VSGIGLLSALITIWVFITDKNLPDYFVRSEKEPQPILTAPDVNQNTKHTQKTNNEIQAKSTATNKVLILVEQSNQYSVRPTLVREIISNEIYKIGFNPVTEDEIGSAKAELVRSAVRESHFEPLLNKLPVGFEVVILGEINAQPLSVVEGMRVFVASGLIKAVSLKTGGSLGIESFQDVRGFGLTEEQAAQRAIQEATSKAAEKISKNLLSTLGRKSL